MIFNLCLIIGELKKALGEGSLCLITKQKCSFSLALTLSFLPKDALKCAVLEGT